MTPAKKLFPDPVYIDRVTVGHRPSPVVVHEKESRIGLAIIFNSEFYEDLFSGILEKKN